MPAGGRAGAANSASAFAKARYGCFVRSIAQGAPARPRDNDGRGAGAAERRRVVRVREKRDVALARLFETGDMADLDLSVAFEPAAQPLGKLSSFIIRLGGQD